MFSMCSKLTSCARIPDTRIPQLMQPCEGHCHIPSLSLAFFIYLEAITSCYRSFPRKRAHQNLPKKKLTRKIPPKMEVALPNEDWHG